MLCVSGGGISGEFRWANSVLVAICYRPILTPKTVLPLFFILGVIFAPIGGLLIYASSEVCRHFVFTISYTCGPFFFVAV